MAVGHCNSHTRAFQFGGKFESLNALRKNEVAETSSGDRGPRLSHWLMGCSVETSAVSGPSAASAIQDVTFAPKVKCTPK